MPGSYESGSVSAATSSRSTGRALARFMLIKSSRPATAISDPSQTDLQRSAAQIRVARSTRRVVQHVDRAVACGELPHRRPRQHRGVDRHALAAGVEDTRAEHVQGIGQPRQVGSIGPREEIDVDRRAHMPMGLNREPADKHILDRVLGQNLKDPLRVKRRFGIHHSPRARRLAGVPPSGSPRSQARAAPLPSVRAERPCGEDPSAPAGDGRGSSGS